MRCKQGSQARRAGRLQHRRGSLSTSSHGQLVHAHSPNQARGLTRSGLARASLVHCKSAPRKRPRANGLLSGGGYDWLCRHHVWGGKLYGWARSLERQRERLQFAAQLVVGSVERGQLRYARFAATTLRGCGHGSCFLKTCAAHEAI